MPDTDSLQPLNHYDHQWFPEKNNCPDKESDQVKTWNAKPSPSQTLQTNQAKTASELKCKIN